MDKWLCTRCDYVYDPDIGDPEHGIEPGMLFDELPKEWVCPDCGAKKSRFELYSETDYLEDESMDEEL